jgi:hypothetical protein
MLTPAYRVTAAGDERSTRNPVVREKARIQHIRNAAEWLRRAASSHELPEGADRTAIIAAHRRECNLANIDPAI